MTGPEILEWLRTRRSVRTFSAEPVARDVLVRVLEGAITAPSSTNRQPWRFAVVRSPSARAKIVTAVAQRTAEMKAIIARSHHAEDFGDYGDFFHEPLAAAQVIVIPQYREYPDLIANLIASGGGDPAQFSTASAMQAELVSASAAIMMLLVQAHAEGLGACMMAGPMVARDDIHALLGIEPPWRMVGAIALGHPTGAAPARGRKPLDRVVHWIEDEETKQ
ncbi:MAG: nitroreductase family protein [Deltaproteobacteria bacterium]|nr:MAG: nitroreductase family protein [Deltaproteobacteria bacterium]TMQ15082.1 MAG: nitroreductase family protein [Deltaproteobacteria bacterium]